MRRLKLWIASALLLIGVTAADLQAQGPYSAQIQAALRAFITQAHTWTGTQTFTDVTIGGTCTGCGGGTAAAGTLTGTTLASNVVNTSITSTAAPLLTSNNGIVVTSTAGHTLQNTTAASAAVPVQMSPRFGLLGHVWNTTAGGTDETSQWVFENLPASAATPTSQLKIGYSANGGALSYPVLVTNGGVLTVSGVLVGASVSSNGNVSSASTSSFLVGVRSKISSTTDALLQLLGSGGSGLELNFGIPTLGTCTGGAVTSGSHNGAGEVTGNTSGSCVLNFGTPSFTNAPFCTLNDETSLVAARVSARSASSITITGLTSGDAVQFICIGRIGT